MCDGYKKQLKLIRVKCMCAKEEFVENNFEMTSITAKPVNLVKF